MTGYPNKRDCEHGRLRGSCEICDYENEIAELKEALARCRHQASYSIGDGEALSNQLAKIREIVNEALAY